MTNRFRRPNATEQACREYVCPTCHAAVGEACRTLESREMRQYAHHARKQLAVDEGRLPAAAVGPEDRPSHPENIDRRPDPELVRAAALRRVVERDR